MNHWLIIRTDLARELSVAREIERMGFPAWVPMEVTSKRIHRTSKTRATTSKPILPKTLFAAIPVHQEADIAGIRYMTGVEHDAYSAPLQIPAIQITIFRDAIDKANQDTMALHALCNPRRKREKWRDLKDGLLELVKQAAERLDVAA